MNQELRNLYLTESFDKPSDSVDAPQKQTNSSETEISEAESSDVSSHFSWNEESSDTSESSEDETVLGKDAKETAVGCLVCSCPPLNLSFFNVHVGFRLGLH